MSIKILSKFKFIHFEFYIFDINFYKLISDLFIIFIVGLKRNVKVQHFAPQDVLFIAEYSDVGNWTRAFLLIKDRMITSYNNGVIIQQYTDLPSHLHK